jgi:hypothetical protein
VIIGVVGDVRQAALGVPATPAIYYAVAQNFAQIRRHGSTLVVRGNGAPEPLAGRIRAAVGEVIPGQALFRVSSMQAVVEESLADPRLYAWLVGLFAAMATLLALAGIYGVIAFLVTQRTREFGIRMALGADTGRVLRLVMTRGAVLTAFGLVLGVAGATLLTRVRPAWPPPDAPPAWILRLRSAPSRDRRSVYGESASMMRQFAISPLPRQHALKRRNSLASFVRSASFSSTERRCCAAIRSTSAHAVVLSDESRSRSRT